MRRLVELLEDERDRLSIARLLPLLTFGVLMAVAIATAIKTGAWPDVPPGWLQLMGITLGGYAARVGVSSFASAIAQGLPGSATNPLPPTAQLARTIPPTPNPHPVTQKGPEDANSAD